MFRSRFILHRCIGSLTESVAESTVDDCHRDEHFVCNDYWMRPAERRVCRSRFRSCILRKIPEQKAIVTKMGIPRAEQYTETLSTLHFHITRKCSCRCRHCSVDAGPHRNDGHLRIHEIQRMVDQAAGLGTVYFDISGGDPLILERQFLLDVIQYASRKGLSACVSTNGRELDKDYAEQLSKAGLQKLKLSFYGSVPETHDGFTTVSGSFESVLSGIRSSKQAGIEVWVNAVVTPLNLAEFQELPALLGPLDVDLVQLSSVVPTGRGMRLSDLVFSEDELGRAIMVLQDKLSGLNCVFTITLFPDPTDPPFDGRHCDYFYDRLVVDHNGDVIPCCLLPENLKHRLGNIREGLSEVYSAGRIVDDTIFSWLGRGHRAMRRKLRYGRMSHNLCSTCIDMLYQITNMGKATSSNESQ